MAEIARELGQPPPQAGLFGFVGPLGGDIYIPPELQVKWLIDWLERIRSWKQLVAAQSQILPPYIRL
jgi:hypothetical protein